jgi:hypothetical protein
MKHSLEQVLDKLYDSELNFSISCVWDNGIDVELGTGDLVHVEANVSTAAEAAEWLDRKAREIYPKSKYATGHSPIREEGNSDLGA